MNQRLVIILLARASLNPIDKYKKLKVCIATENIQWDKNHFISYNEIVLSSSIV